MALWPASSLIVDMKLFIPISGFHQPTCRHVEHSRPSVCLHAVQKWDNKPVRIDSRMQNIAATHLCLLQAVEKFDCLHGLNNNKTIVDKIEPNIIYDCPMNPMLQTEINTPSSTRTTLPIETPGTSQLERVSPGTSTLEKLADKNLMRIRRRKMKKHQRSRRHDRIWPILRRVRFQTRQRKKQVLKSYVAKMKRIGQEYDPFAVITANLEFVRKRGYYVDIFGEKSRHFGFADGLKDVKKTKHD